METPVGGSFRLLSPTDCVKDRLANFYHFEDGQCLEQAPMVAGQHPVNWVEPLISAIDAAR